MSDQMCPGDGPTADRPSPDPVPGSSPSPGGDPTPTGCDRSGAASRTTPVPTGPQVSWHRSVRDLQWSHAYEVVSEQFSEALCTHSVPTSLLVAASERMPDDACHGCRLVIGDLIAASLGDRDLYQP